VIQLIIFRSSSQQPCLNKLEITSEGYTDERIICHNWKIFEPNRRHPSFLASYLCVKRQEVPSGPGDKVMQIENDYGKEVYNGDIGHIDDDPAAGEIVVTFDGPVRHLWIRRTGHAGAGLRGDHS
jgi:hypothetical protein